VFITSIQAMNRENESNHLLHNPTALSEAAGEAAAVFRQP
jgi:hypothetical protein